VRQEEQATEDRLAGQKTSFSAFLMTHNTKVSIFTLALGMTWGVGTILLLFANGVTLGAIAVDYVQEGQTKFLLGWLLPHGVIEIPAILIAGQAGLVLALALIGWGKRTPLTARLRAVSRDLATLIFGVGILLVWAGFVEAFLSQYHEPVIPYELKISFGLVELIVLWLFLAKSGKERSEVGSQRSGSKNPEPPPGNTRDERLQTRDRLCEPARCKSAPPRVCSSRNRWPGRSPASWLGSWTCCALAC
jgi:uncharacterized membrane protein SpoIIM required for sporulation